LKHLISISPTGPVSARRSSTIQDPNSSKNLTKHESNSFLILIPIVADSKTKCRRLFDSTFSPDDLQHISELLIELKKERTNQRILNFASKTNASPSSDSTIPTTRAVNVNTVENYQKMNEDDDDDDSGESSDGSRDLFVHRMKIDNSDIVHNWLHDNNLTGHLNEDKSGEDFKFFRYHLLKNNSSNSYFCFFLRYTQPG
jgi:hypothetical protein